MENFLATVLIISLWLNGTFVRRTTDLVKTFNMN